MMYILCTAARNELRGRERFCDEFSLIIIHFQDQEGSLYRQIIGFIFLRASCLSVLKCICKFTVLLTFISHKLRIFFSQAQLSSHGDI